MYPRHQILGSHRRFSILWNTFLVITLMASPGGVRAEDIHEALTKRALPTIEKAIAAHGGRDALASVQSCFLVSDMEVARTAPDDDGKYVVLRAAAVPSSVRVDLRKAGHLVYSFGIVDQTPWRNQSVSGSASWLGMSLQEFLRNSYYPSDRKLNEPAGTAFDPAGIGLGPLLAVVRGHAHATGPTTMTVQVDRSTRVKTEAIRVESDGKKVTIFIHPETGRIVGIEQDHRGMLSSGPTRVSTFFADYRDVDGILVPFVRINNNSDASKGRGFSRETVTFAGFDLDLSDRLALNDQTALPTSLQGLGRVTGKNDDQVVFERPTGPTGPSGVMRDDQVATVMGGSGSKADLQMLTRLFVEHGIQGKVLTKGRMTTSDEFLRQCMSVQATIDGSVDAWLGGSSYFDIDLLNSNLSIAKADPERGFVALNIRQGTLGALPYYETLSLYEAEQMRRKISSPLSVDRHRLVYRYDGPEDFDGLFDENQAGLVLVQHGTRDELERLLQAIDEGRVVARSRVRLLPGRSVPDTWTIPRELKGDRQALVNRRGVSRRGGVLSEYFSLDGGTPEVYQVVIESPEKRAERLARWTDPRKNQSMSGAEIGACVFRATVAVELYIDGESYRVFSRPHSSS
ncbi:MAG: hypothetical protein KDA27_27500 [Candidatus Eisenbacteria bacterium]|uniref:Uncharacterized protein n=1 Tax=Eiseniibacteriota bacterium TaxID=2212470 RepID=A0A956NHM4_UNCEI|nr:hypothetical protein [Candidatus Eisenbacteria bacterium]